MKFLSSISPRRKFKLILRAFLIVISVFSAYAASICIQEGHYALAMIPTLIVLSCGITEFIVAVIWADMRYPIRTARLLDNYRDKINQSRDQLAACLSDARDSLKACDKECLNATLHLVVELYSSFDDLLEHAFIQITSYNGNLGGPQWRFSSTYKGVIGRCFRSREVEIANFTSQDDYRNRMIQDFGYTREEVSSHTTAARSYLAYPLISRGNFIGVLYMFSTEQQVFPHASDKQELAQIANNIVRILEVGTII